MKQRILFMCFIMLGTFFTSTAFCQGNEPTTIIIEGLTSYKQNGPRAAVTTWIKGSAMEGSKDALAQANNLRKIEDYYGGYVDYEIIKTHQLSKRVTIISMIMNYETGPLFTRFDMYKNTQGQWVLSQFDFHTKGLQVYPAQFFMGLQK